MRSVVAAQMETSHPCRSALVTQLRQPFNRARRDLSVMAFPERNLTCPCCGNGFVGRHPRSKFCSAPCAAKGERVLNRARYAKNPEHFRSMRNASYARCKIGQRQRPTRSAVAVPEAEKVKARYLLNLVVRGGVIARGCCRDCGSPDTHGHHVDYSEPLAVVWLCPIHHKREHQLGL